MVREISNEKRARFLQAALKLFAAKGVQSTSTAEIARGAGTAAGTLFLYFPTKQDLINALILEISKQEGEAIQALLAPSLSARDQFFTIWDGSIRWLLDHPEAYQYAQQVRDSGLISPEVSLESGKHLRFYYEAIQKGLEEGSLKPFPIDLIGGFLYQDIVAMMNYIRMQSNPDGLELSIRQGFDLFWDGIKINEKD
jgi:AcrR family transcriptional regulator